MSSSQFKMTTTFGKRRGWEIQRLRLRKGGTFYRVTTSNSCWPATECEVQLWRLAKLTFGTDGEKGGGT